jgi:O-antigen ligase
LQSTLRGPNPLGAYLVLVITLTVSLFIKNKNRRLIGIIFVIVALIVIFFTYSRSAWLGLVLANGLLIYQLIQNRKTRQLIFGIGITIAVILASTIAIFNRHSIVNNTLLHSDKSSRALDSSNEVRIEAVNRSLKSVVEQPWGRGPGTAGPASFRNHHSPRLAENYYLQVAQEVGIIGLAIFITINFLIVKKLWQLRRQLLATALLASFIGLLIVNMLSHAWADDTLSLLWWGMAGIALSSVILKQNAKKAKT